MLLGSRFVAETVSGTLDTTSWGPLPFSFLQPLQICVLTTDKEITDEKISQFIVFSLCQVVNYWVSAVCYNRCLFTARFKHYVNLTLPKFSDMCRVLVFIQFLQKTQLVNRGMANIFGAFAKLCEESVRSQTGRQVAVYPSAWNTSTPIRRIFVKVDI